MFYSRDPCILQADPAAKTQRVKSRPPALSISKEANRNYTTSPRFATPTSGEQKVNAANKCSQHPDFLSNAPKIVSLPLIAAAAAAARDIDDITAAVSNVLRKTPSYISIPCCLD